MTQEKHIPQGEQPNQKPTPTAGSSHPLISLVPIPSLVIDNVKVNFQTTNISNQHSTEINQTESEQPLEVMHKILLDKDKSETL